MTNTARKVELTRNEWDNEEEVSDLRRLVAQKETDEDIAAYLAKKYGNERSSSSVTNKRHAMGLLKGKPRKPSLHLSKVNPKQLREEMKAHVAQQAKPDTVTQAATPMQDEKGNGGIKNSYPRVIISLAGMSFDAIVKTVSELEGKGFFCKVELQANA